MTTNDMHMQGPVRRVVYLLPGKVLFFWVVCQLTGSKQQEVNDILGIADKGLF